MSIATFKGLVVRDAKLFETGDYEDKGLLATTETLDAFVDNFLPVQVKIEHGDSPLDGFVGVLQSLWRKGKELFGKIGFTPEAWTLLDKAGAKKLSVGISEDQTRIVEVSVVNYPRVSSAQVYNFFGAICPVDDNKEDNMGERSNVVQTEASEQAGAATFSKADVDKIMAEFAAKIGERDEQNQKLQAQIEEIQADKILMGLKQSGKLTPAMEPIAKALLGQTSVIQFGEEKKSTRTLVTELIEAMPTSVKFGEQGEEPKQSEDGAADAGQFSSGVIDIAGRLGVSAETLAKWSTDGESKVN